MAAIPNAERYNPFPEISFKANHWLNDRLASYGKDKLEDLTPEERSDLVSTARSEAKNERAKSISTAILVSLAILVALPALVVITFLIGSGCMTLAPDSLLYPLLAGGIAAGGYGGFKLTKALIHLYNKTVCTRLEYASNLDRLASRL